MTKVSKNEQKIEGNIGSCDLRLYDLLDELIFELPGGFVRDNPKIEEIVSKSHILLVSLRKAYKEEENKFD